MAFLCFLSAAISRLDYLMQEGWNWTNAKGGRKKRTYYQMSEKRVARHHGNVHVKMVQKSASFTFLNCLIEMQRFCLI